MSGQPNLNKKSISILVLGLLIGVAVFAVVSAVVHYSIGPFIEEYSIEKNVWVVYLAVAVLLIGVSRRHYQQRVDALDQSMGVQADGQSYVKVTIRHLAFCEGISILSIVLFLLFGDFLLFIPVGISLAEMSRIYFKIKSADNAPF